MYDDGPEALCIDIPVLIKARSDGDRRLVEPEASNEAVDGEGDVIKQAALLDDAGPFIATGHLDKDHCSEIGERPGIANPTDYIVGVPLEVKDFGKGVTGVRGELHKSGRRVADEIWSSLTTQPRCGGGHPSTAFRRPEWWKTCEFPSRPIRAAPSVLSLGPALAVAGVHQEPG
jgi:hypothetical protein